MGQEIESGKWFIKDVFSQWYRIPEYQRPYVWDSEQVIELLNDVMNAVESNEESQYFLGSMVLKKTTKIEGKTTYLEYDVLDGQQRLTTLFLLTAVVRDLSKEREETCQKSIYQEENSDDNIPERLRIMFDIRDSVKKFVGKYIKEIGSTLNTDLETIANDCKRDISIQNMAKAILTIREYLNKNNGNIGRFYRYLRSNVLMIYVATEEVEDAFRLFTVMNSRGVKLRNSDILKSLNLEKVPKAKRIDYAKKWENTEAYFGEDFDTFLSHIRTILVKQKPISSLLKEFEDNIYEPKKYDRTTKKYINLKPLLQKGEDTIDLIDEYSDLYQTLFDNVNSNLVNSLELYNYLLVMQKGFEADFWIAPLLKFGYKFKIGNDLLKFVKLLDRKFANDWMTGLTPTKRIEHINAIINAIDEANEVNELFSHLCFNVDMTELDTLLSNKIYGKGSTKYLMLKLEHIYHGNTTKIDIPATVSIEHILPQTPKDNSQWKIDYSDQEREEWVNKLGNLVLISRKKNASQGNKDYAEKKEKYFKNNVELFSHSIKVYQEYQTWSFSDLQKHHNEVLSKIKENWENI